MPGIDRRRFLGASILATTAPALAGRAAPMPLRPARSFGQARNAIVMVSDGMSAGTLSLADDVRRLRDGRQSHWADLLTEHRAITALQRTCSLDSLVTDSAAASSAWGAGRKVANGALNFTPEGAEPEPILVTARRAGKAAGLVTTTRITHATPAGFVANVPNRALEAIIAQQTLSRGVDVALGGGAAFFPDDLVAQHPDLIVVRDRESLLACGPTQRGRLLGLFNRSHMSFALDRPDTEPTLAEMTRAALNRLDAAPGGFILQIEGGRVDHAAHSNDAGALIADQLAFDDALAAALGFVAERDDTLLIVTTDHGNANPGLTVYGREAARGLDRLSSMRKSFEWIAAEAKANGGTPDARAAAISAAAGFELTPDELGLLERATRRERIDPFGPANAPECVLGSLLANHLGVRFLSPNHTGDLVHIAALGPGAQALPPIVDNTQVYELLVNALGLVA